MLRSLSLEEARCRRVLGRLAAAFRRIGGHRRLCFPRLDDYARERLGLSGRELQSLASIALRLEELPAVTLAFERGELSWSRLRLVAAVARPGSEPYWLERAQGRTVRSLVGEIERLRGEAGAPGAGATEAPCARVAEASASPVAGEGVAALLIEVADRPDLVAAGDAGAPSSEADSGGFGASAPGCGVGPAGESIRPAGESLHPPGESTRPADPELCRAALDEERGTIEGEESVRIRIRCPSGVRLLWRRTVELARRMLGAQGPVWKAAEAATNEAPTRRDAATGVAWLPGTGPSARRWPNHR